MSFEPADDLYREVVLDHHRHPRGHEPLAHPDREASGVNPACGDEVKLQINLDDGGRIAEVGVLSHGCAISTSSGSMLAEIVRGLTLAQARQVAEAFSRLLKGDDAPAELDLGDLEALVGVRRFPVRIKCALLPWVTLLDAIAGAEEAAGPAGSAGPPAAPPPAGGHDERREP